MLGPDYLTHFTFLKNVCGLKREREKLQDDQLGGQGARGAFRRTRELDSTQRQLLGYQDCKTQVQARFDALPV